MAIYNINKLREKDIPSIIDFVSSNSFSQYDDYKPNKKEFYENMLNRFVKDKAKFAYCSKSKEGRFTGALLFEELSFDTKLFGVKTVQLKDIIISQSQDRNKVFDKTRLLMAFFMKEMNKQKVKFIQCKLDSRNRYIAQVLEKLGFMLASVDVNFIKDLVSINNNKNKNKGHSYSISSCNDKDVDYLYEMSKKAYSTTRFHNDPKITKEQADEMQALWAKNCYHQKLADKIIIVRKSKKILGYVAIEILKGISFPNNMKIANIVLIAVDKKFKGRGIGKVLIQESSDWAKSNGCSFLAAGTQIINNTSVKFYQKNGFKLQSSVLSFHKWMQ
jgi:GNAT superfamily N-acetyltransferase|tara:strand:+ start:420 stop:1412 length:993 start_codon:yes stop_codon:yes gene_type:complete